MCFQKKMPIARAVEEDPPVVEGGEQLNHLYDTAYVIGNTKQSTSTFMSTFLVNGKQCRGLLDTGATQTLITEDIVPTSRPSPRTLRAYDGNAVVTLGVADVVIKARNKTCSRVRASWFPREARHYSDKTSSDNWSYCRRRR